MNHFHVYLVEDEKNLAEVIKAYMEKEGWKVKHFSDGKEAAEHIDSSPHLWVLDIMLPGMDGYQLLKAIKSRNDTPVIFISARDKDLDRVLGLELGSDDYLAKPFLPEELVIRAKKLLERIYKNDVQAPEQFTLNGYTIDPNGRTVKDGNEPIELTTKEMDLVILLTSNISKSLSREEIIEYVWGSDYYGSERAVDDVVRRVRKKLPRIHVETLYGYGYRVLSS
ncbi:response regulator transcription factor [Evansella cellulosilytica]|uniref:Two component transcriptional regulator, winged helix family n=1 Tax=Evansella cellulosilytica (strain ATCC 21833 / DSM 2522 / FERM P-1141 / JCM 9156 / N-4) TaxID=649639 RepID=E6TUG7_EVAC2|nr:response regulator transcription factor [Evansella cellulosilytica]ADU29723.1 two component transcriptional regulator, winged helix family [Evansella cellulosilytica DSM 2522]